MNRARVMFPRRGDKIKALRGLHKMKNSLPRDQYTDNFNQDSPLARDERLRSYLATITRILYLKLSRRYQTERRSLLRISCNLCRTENLHMKHKEDHSAVERTCGQPSQGNNNSVSLRGRRP